MTIRTTTIAACLFALTATTATAEPIIYQWTGVGGNGSVNGSSFSGMDWNITLVGDTTTTYPHNATVTANPGTATMHIDSVGTFTFTEPNLGIFVSEAGPIVGFWKINTLDYLNFQSNVLTDWDLASPIGPIVDITPGAPTQFVNVASTAGPVTLSSTGLITFRATIDCPAAPALGCSNPEKGSLQLLGYPGDTTKQKLKWKWLNGTADLADFGSPVTVGSDSYMMCIYDDDAPVQQLRLASLGDCGGKPCWSTNGTKTTKYKSKTGNEDGISGVKFSAGIGKAKISVSGKGAPLMLPFPITDASSVKVQLWRYSGGSSACWQTTFASPAKTNDSMKLKFVDSMP